MNPPDRHLDELRQTLAVANASGEKAHSISLSGFDRILELTPEDMTVTVQAGLTLESLQRQLAEKRQWLPIDPPHPDRISIGSLLDSDSSGPRRFGFGTIRDYVIGLKVMLPDGRLIRSGGKVVKNVAGYDLQKVFVGGQGTLGIIVEATFKLRPLPQMEKFISIQCPSLTQAEALLEAMARSPVTPSILDLHRLAPTANKILVVVAGFSGSTEEVDWQMAQVAGLGSWQAATLDYENEFWSNRAGIRRLSVLPSRLCATIEGLGETSFVARAGNGVIYLRGPGPAPERGLPLALMQRLKNEFDPKNILPSLPW